MGWKETSGTGGSQASFLSLQAAHPPPDILHSRLMLFYDEDISTGSAESVCCKSWWNATFVLRAVTCLELSVLCFLQGEG